MGESFSAEGKARAMEELRRKREERMRAAAETRADVPPRPEPAEAAAGSGEPDPADEGSFGARGGEADSDAFPEPPPPPPPFTGASAPRPSPEPGKTPDDAGSRRDPLPTPRTIPTPKEAAPVFKSLDEARAAYLKAKKAIEDSSSALGLLKRAVGKTSVQKLEQALTEARSEYAFALAEYKISVADTLIEEKAKMVDERTAQYAKKGKLDVRRAYDWYKGLGNMNLTSKLEKRGVRINNKALRFATNMVNVRTAVTTGLLGVGLAVGVGSTLGIGIVGLRRAIGAFGAGGGSFEAAQLLKRRHERKVMQKQDRSTLSPEEQARQLLENMASIESQAFLDGQGQAYLQHDELYNKLRQEYEALIQTPEFNGMPQQDFIEQQLKIADEAGVKRFKSNRNFRRGALAVSAGIAYLVGSGEMAKLTGKAVGGIKKIFGFGAVQEAAAPGGSGSGNPDSNAQVPPTHTEAPPANPANPPVNEAPPTHTEAPISNPGNPPVQEHAPTPPADTTVHEAPAGNPDQMPEGAVKLRVKNAWATMGEKGEVNIHVGSRGLEGALLDLKDAKPDQYGKMIEWIKSQEGLLGKTDAANTDDKLIHRFILKFAHDNDFSVGDGGEQDLSRMFKAGIQIGKGGEITIQPPQSGDFMPVAGEHPVAGVADSDATITNGHMGHGMPKGAKIIKPLELKKIGFRPNKTYGIKPYGNSGIIQNVQEQAPSGNLSSIASGGNRVAEGFVGVTSPNNVPYHHYLNQADEFGIQRRVFYDAQGKVITTQEISSNANNTSGVRSFRGSGGGGGGGEAPAHTETSVPHQTRVIPKTSGGNPIQTGPKSLEQRAQELLAQSQREATMSRAQLEQMGRAHHALTEATGGGSKKTEHLMWEALKMHDTSKALKKVLGKGYNSFLKQFEISPQALDTSGASNMSLMEFFKKFENSPDFRGARDFIDTVVTAKKDEYLTSDEFARNVTVKEFLLRFAPAYMKNH